MTKDEEFASIGLFSILEEKDEELHKALLEVKRLRETLSVISNHLSDNPAETAWEALNFKG